MWYYVYNDEINMFCVEMCLIRLLIVKVVFIFNYNLINLGDFFFVLKIVVLKC